MKKIIIIIVICLILFISSIKASLPLTGKLIIIDVGHGGVDKGASYGNVYEKDINLAISLKLRDVLVSKGCSVILDRDGDYDLASPDISRRKKNDFDNRISLINSSGADMYLSIHTNYLSDSSYYGAQVFYDKEDVLASKIQSRLNTISYPRSIKKIPNIYMYPRLKIKGVLIEVGFLSNGYERDLLINSDYQYKLVNEIVNGVIDYFN